MPSACSPSQNTNKKQRKRPDPSPPPSSSAQIQKVLDENCGLIQTIQDYQNKGKASECISYHQALHRNLLYMNHKLNEKK